MSRRFPPIPHFVEPYPDESCYSILCRCAVRSALSMSRFRRTMFGKQRFMSYYLWQPFQAEELNVWFDDAADKAKRYLLEHSCIPYRYSLLNRACHEDYEFWATGEELPAGVYQRLTLKLGCRLWSKRYLYYCPECVRSDRKQYGETYWHMIPQLPGVYVCPVHVVPLEQTSLMQGNSWMDLHPAEYWLPDTRARRETVSYDDLQLAMDTKRMMENGWGKEINVYSLLEGMSSWQFEQAEAKTNRFTRKQIVKNETAYYILLANMKGKSIADFMVDKEIIGN